MYPWLRGSAYLMRSHARSNTFCRSHKVGDYSRSVENRWPPSYERLDPAKAACWWEWVHEGARPPQAATICSLSYTRLTPPHPESASPMALFPPLETVPPAGNIQGTSVSSWSHWAYVFVLIAFCGPEIYGNVSKSQYMLSNDVQRSDVSSWVLAPFQIWRSVTECFLRPQQI